MSRLLMSMALVFVSFATPTVALRGHMAGVAEMYGGAGEVRVDNN